MTGMLVCFWISTVVFFYTYLVYPFALALVARLFGSPPRKEDGPVSVSVSVVIAAHNEAQNIGRRIREFQNLFDQYQLVGEIIVVSDGSTDATADEGRAVADSRTRIFELNPNGGKAVALTTGCKEARNDILVFADSRQTWAPSALSLMLENFRDPQVGAVTGDLVLESAPGIIAGVGLYWRYEKWIRANEGLLHSTVGATGAISCVRRELFRPLPQGTILDDVFWPLGVALQGRRVIHDRRAEAFDALPSQSTDEFRRKVRTLSGNFQLLRLLPEVNLPWKNPIWVQWVSHKLMRLLVPWALICMLITSALIPSWYYRCFFAMQVLGYLLAGLALLGLPGKHSRLATTAYSFVLLNAAAWIAFWVWITGRSARSWSKVNYSEAQISAS